MIKKLILIAVISFSNFVFAKFTTLDILFQDTTGFRSLSEVKPQKEWLDSYHKNRQQKLPFLTLNVKKNSEPSMVRQGLSFLLSEDYLVKEGYTNPDVILRLNVNRDKLKSWLLKKDEMDESLHSELTVLNTTWHIPKKFYFYNSRNTTVADNLYVEAWHPFVIHINFEYYLQNKKIKKERQTSTWITKDDLLSPYL